MRSIKTILGLVFQGAVAGIVALLLFINYTNHLPTPAPAQVIQTLPKDWQVLTTLWGERLGLPSHLLGVTCGYESENTRPRTAALSKKGAVGTCQVLPTTAAFMLGIADPTLMELIQLHRILTVDEEINVMFGGRYLSYCYKRRWHKVYITRIKHALWCYNEGHNSKPKTKSVYIDRVMAKWYVLNPNES